jgi:hypothetical protein
MKNPDPASLSDHSSCAISARPMPHLNCAACREVAWIDLDGAEIAAPEGLA